MAEDKQVKKYFENMPYGKDSKPSEIHGKKNQGNINKFIANLVVEYDKNIEAGNKEMAGNYNGAIKQIAKDLDNLKAIKEEFAMNYGGGTGGKNLFSNYTDLSWDRAFMIEQGMISFDKNMRPVLSVIDQNGEPIMKHIEDITQDWVVKGTEEADFMKMQQDAVKQRNTMGNELDFDINWAVSKLLDNGDGRKIMATDKIGGNYFLNTWMEENSDALAAGEIPDEMLHPDSFNPEFDTRLHKHYSDRIKKAFDFNYMSDSEKREAENLMAKIKTPKKSKI